MSFTFTIPGQPPSVNHNYRIVRVKHRDGGSHQQLAKVPGLEQYQLVVSSITRRACPADWVPSRQIRIHYWFHLQRDKDCDNMLKALNDAIALGLGVNDKAFLPCVVEKTTGNKEPYVEIEVSNIES